jgi:hypothetical protein
MAIDQCFEVCASNPTCDQQCYANNPAGASDYMAALNCIECEQCPTACGMCTM